MFTVCLPHSQTHSSLPRAISRLELSSTRGSSSLIFFFGFLLDSAPPPPPHARYRDNLQVLVCRRCQSDRDWSPPPNPPHRFSLPKPRSQILFISQTDEREVGGGEAEQALGTFEM